MLLKWSLKNKKKKRKKSKSQHGNTSMTCLKHNQGNETISVCDLFNACGNPSEQM